MYILAISIVCQFDGKINLFAKKSANSFELPFTIQQFARIYCTLKMTLFEQKNPTKW